MASLRPTPPAESRRPSRAAGVVAAGILVSRLFGLARNRALAHYLGTSAAADAFNAAFKIPNILQNLFGEGVLSASFIPVYARLLSQGDSREARRTAEAIAGILGIVIAVFVLGGIVATPWLIDLIAPGFSGEKRALTIRLVRIFFPGAGLLVLSAWCLGVLNSHRRFFLSYAAPVVWNVAIIGSLLFSRATDQFALAEVAAWGAVVGSGLQLAVQLPTVRSLLGRLRPTVAALSTHVRTVIRNFVPVFFGRGVVQISAYVDTVLASLLPTGAVAAVAYAQVLYTLPVSVFGMSVSAAELPAMSSAGGDDAARAEQVRRRLAAGLRSIAFFVVPSAVAFLALGDLIVATIYQSGAFTREMSVYVWVILAGAAIGLPASTFGRLYASAYYALHDTRTPVRFAVVRVLLAIAIGYLAAVAAPPALGIDRRWGAAGITLAASLAGWVELGLLRRALHARIGSAAVTIGLHLRLVGSALAAALVAWGVSAVVPFGGHPILLGLSSLGAYAIVYLALTAAAGVPEARSFLARRRQGGG